MITNPMDTTPCPTEQIEDLFKNQQMDVSALALAFPGQLVYVAQDGSNVTGTGDISAPYATVSFAMTQITTNTTSKPFFIVVVGAITEASPVALKPNVSIIGVSPGATLTISGGNAVTANASWSTAGSGSISFLYNLTISKLDFNPAAPVTANLRMYFVIVSGTTAFNSSTNAMQVLAYNCIFSGTFAVDNINLFTYTNRYIGAVNIAQGTLVRATGFFSNYDSYFSGANTLLGKLGQSFASQLSLVACQVFSNFTGAGTGAFTMDAISRPQAPKTLTLTDSSTLTLTSSSTSVGLPSTFNPTNYTVVPVANTTDSVQGALQGIDNALAPVGSNAPWVIVAGTSQTMVAGKNYLATNTGSQTVFTMPTTMAAGQVINVAGISTVGFRINMANGSQSLTYGIAQTTAGGHLEVTSPTDNPNSAVSIVCSDDDQAFLVVNSQGNFTLA